MGLLSAHEIAGMTATLSLVANARLVNIYGPATVDDYGDMLTTTTVWTGSVPGYFADSTEDTSGVGGQQDLAHRNTFTILDASGAPVIEVAGPQWSGSIIRISDQRLSPAVLKNWRVVTAAHTANGLLDSLVLELEAA